uniref:Granulins domain-containing protein n=1 Tax=Electrophorus electricus TaxID=8005 RepID=A0AAY5EDR9_ELEEL
MIGFTFCKTTCLGSDVPCNDTVACLDGSTCCKTAQGDWACCPIPKVTLSLSHPLIFLGTPLQMHL